MNLLRCVPVWHSALGSQLNKKSIHLTFGLQAISGHTVQIKLSDLMPLYKDSEKSEDFLEWCEHLHVELVAGTAGRGLQGEAPSSISSGCCICSLQGALGS